MRKGWDKQKLKDLCEVITKGTTPTSIGFDFTQTGINFIKIESITTDGKFIKDKFAAISEKCNSALKRSQLKENDILFSIAGALGRTAIVNKEILPANTNQALAIVRLKENINVYSRFVLLALNLDLMFEQVEKSKGGVAQQNLSLQQLGDFEIPIPPLPEQKHIVAILDEAFATIDKAKANTEKNLQNAKELFESYLQGVFENGSWETYRFADLCNLITCGVASTPKYVDESIGVPFLSAQNVKDGKVVLDKYKFISKEFHAELTKKNKPQKGDILYSRVGAKYGEAGVVEHDFEFSVYVSLTLIKPKLELLDNYFLKHLLNSPAVKEMAKKSISSSGVPNLNVNDVREFKTICPPLSQQKKLVKEIEKMREETKKLEAIYQQKLDCLEELKKSILQKAFSGELTEKTVLV